MNLKDVEWDPAPTEPEVLRKVRSAVKGCVSSHDISKLRTMLLGAGIDGAIPNEIRGSVWLLLLGLRAEDLLAEDLSLFARSARNAVSEANSKEQIEKDVERTRPGLVRFKQRTVRGALLRLLSLFCDRRQVAYVQGFNELLAPFILLADTGGNPRIVYALFNEFVSRFASWMLDTSESRVFDVLKRAFKYFERLLLYHDPQLYWLLEDNMMTPDLYATSWFVTLFARNFTVECVMALWDLLLLSDNPLGLVFFGIAMVTDRRKQLLETDPSRIPETLMMLSAESPEDVRKLWRRGSEMQARNTPPSFQRLMTNRLLTQYRTSPSNAITAARSMQASVCLQTTPDDLVAGEAQFATWDCRTLPEFRSGHLQQANFLPLDALRACSVRGSDHLTEEAKAELKNALSLCEKLDSKSHVCLIGSGVRDEDDADINTLAKHLTKLGIPYVSTLRGGFKVALAVSQSGSSLTSVELSDFDEAAHKQARNLRLNAAALAAEEEYANHRRLDGRPHNMSDMDIAATSPADSSRDTPSSTASGASSTKDWSGTYMPGSVPGISSLLERTTDSEMGRALNRALVGIGVPGFSSGERPSPASSTRTEVSPADSSTSAGPFTPNALASPVTPGLPDLARSSSSTVVGQTAPGARGRKGGTISAENSPRVMEAGGMMSPMPGVASGFSGGGSVSSSPNVERAVRTAARADESPWGRDARANWLSEESLGFPLALMPKGFTVNVMDDTVMAGLRLFPCRAKAERSSRMRGGRAAEFRRRYVGVSAHYFLLLAPHASKSHLLEVKAIRYLQDITRIAFKRARPELVTFEVRVAGPKSAAVPNENFVCIMPDGLRECVRLVKEYLATAPPENDLDLEGTPASSAQNTPRSDVGSGQGTPTAIAEAPMSGGRKGGRPPKASARRDGKNITQELELNVDSSDSGSDMNFEPRKSDAEAPENNTVQSARGRPAVPSHKLFSVDDSDTSPSPRAPSRNR